jgi:hypothetical protein
MPFLRAYSDVGGESIQPLKATGAALFGPRWKAALASHIGVTRETVSRWCNGRAAPPEWALFFIRELVKGRGAVLSLCDRTGNMLEPWVRAGFDCIAVDIRHTGTEKRGGIAFTRADVRRLASAAAPLCYCLRISALHPLRRQRRTLVSRKGHEWPDGSAGSGRGVPQHLRMVGSPMDV